MEIKYSKHASLRLKVRAIDKSEAEEVIRNPKEVYYDILTDVLIAIGKRANIRDHWLIVAYTKHNDTYHVVTVIDTKSINKIIEKRVAKGRWIKLW